MPTVYKVLGQTTVSSNTDTTLYTVPAATQTVVSTIVVCNRGASPYTYRIALRPAGAAIATNHYIAFDSTIAANDSIAITVGLTMGATDIITVRASNSNVNFSAFGSEVS